MTEKLEVFILSDTEDCWGDTLNAIVVADSETQARELAAAGDSWGPAGKWFDKIRTTCRQIDTTTPHVFYEEVLR